jgi:SSS family solute:Na+ symporter
MALSFTWLDWFMVGGYFVLLIILSIKKNPNHANEEGYLLSGRSMTLPAFVATLVSTFYGGILGVGEFGYSSGLVQVVVLGLPFYIFSLLFAWLVAGRIREHNSLTLVEAIRESYGERAGNLASLFIFMLVSPAPYILMLGLIFQYMSGGDGHFLLYAVLVSFFSVAYVSFGGFDAVVRTDMLQVTLMFGGFFALLLFGWSHYGDPITLWQSIPEGHRDPTGGNTTQYLLVWFFIALWTFVDPSFHQRAAAAKTPGIARKGIVLSVLCWVLFDFFTLFTALYGLQIMGEIDQAAMVYPYLANAILPMGMKGLFFVALLATIMSTMDSYMFISGQTLGRDFLLRFFPRSGSIPLTRLSIVVAAIIGIVLIMIYPSVVDLWYVIGTVIIPGLLFPVLGIYIPAFKIARSQVFSYMVVCSGVSLIWLILGTMYPDTPGGYTYLGMEPFYPGLAMAVIWKLTSHLGRATDTE